jgi:hypothetical protein
MHIADLSPVARQALEYQPNDIRHAIGRLRQETRDAAAAPVARATTSATPAQPSLTQPLRLLTYGSQLMDAALPETNASRPVPADSDKR